MKSLFLLAALALAVGCSGSKKARMSDPHQPEFQQIKSYYEILDDDTGQRVGFVEKTQYDSGRVLYWVTDPKRELKYGYFLPNGSAYRFEWVGGQRAEKPKSLGADVYSANARRILGYARPVRLEVISLEALVAEHQPKPKAEPSKAKEGGGEEDE
ncbi:MAG: hypothetical protein ACYTDU_12080 [Planctomycetota bacterium]|jgi:hypothetical protein